MVRGIITNPKTITHGIYRGIGRQSLITQYPYYTLYFDGVDDYVDVGTVSSFSFIQNTLKFTIEAWIKINDLDARQSIMGNAGTTNEKGITFMWETYGSGYGDHSLRFVAYNGAGIAIDAHSDNFNTITDNNWHHVIVKSTGAGNNITFYVDDVAKTTTYKTSYTSLSAGDSTRTLFVGASNSGSGAVLVLNSTIAFVRIYNRALNSTEIRYNMMYPFDSVKSGLVLWLPFMEYGGSVVKDWSGNNNNGTIHSATWKKIEKYPLYSNIGI